MKPSPLIAILLFALFIVFRTNALTRDLAFEEGTYLTPGRSFMEGTGFFMFLGEAAKEAHPFHKPPLASLLPGLLSYLSHDWIAAGRLAPLLVGLFTCFFVWFEIYSPITALVAILSPYLLASAGQIQTDPIAGLLGSGFIALAILSETRRFLYLALGLSVLWAGKLELMICANTALGLAWLALPDFRKKFPLKVALFANLIGLGSYLLLSLVVVLGTYGNLSKYLDLILTPWLTMLRIGDYVAGGAIAPHGAHPRSEVLIDLKHWKYFHLWILAYVPLVWFAFRSQVLRKNISLWFPLVLLTLINFLVYYLGGWRGDGFPRYFLMSVPPLLALLAWLDREILTRAWRFTLIFATLLLFTPTSLKALRTGDGLTGRSYLTGYRESALLLKHMTLPGDWVVGPEPSLPYLRDRKWLELEVLSYEGNMKIFHEHESKVKAAILPAIGSHRTGEWHTGLRSLRERLLNEGATEVEIGSFFVIGKLRPSRLSIPPYSTNPEVPKFR